MIKSMTGFGLATVETETMTVTVEVKTLNSKGLEIFVRQPRAYSDKEIEVRNIVGSQLERGKINVSIDVTPKGTAIPRVAVNRPLVKAYYQDLLQTAEFLQFGSISEATHIQLLRLAMEMPEATTPLSDDSTQTKNNSDWEYIQQAINQALANCNQFRSDEGQTLKAKLTDYLQNIGTLLNEVEKHDPQRIAATRQRLLERVQELSETITVDTNRFEQELIYYIEKLDIAEEKVRLRSHLTYALEALELEGSGKKLGFMAQEIGREINTIGSKVNDALIQRMVVQMKEELEKLKEQSLNIV